MPFGNLYPAQQHQYQQNDQNRTDDPRWTVAPAARVREDWQAADQQQDQDNDKNCADAHDEFLLWFLVNGYNSSSFYRSGLKFVLLETSDSGRSEKIRRLNDNFYI